MSGEFSLRPLASSPQPSTGRRLVHEFTLINITGWMSLLSWQAGSASGCYIIGNIVQSMIIWYHPTTYVAARWQGTLFAIAIAIVQAMGNTLGAKLLPRMQKLFILPHAFGWIAVVIVLWVMAPHASAKDVFTNFSSNGGWQPIGLSLMVGQITPVCALICTSIELFFRHDANACRQYLIRRHIWLKKLTWPRHQFPCP
jgi:amino acid transporter